MIRLLVALSFCLAACEPSDMGLPTSREETATPANPVSSNTTNAIQDAIMRGARGARWRFIPPVAGAIVQGAIPANFNTRWSGGVWIATAANDRHSIPIEMAEGERLLEVRGYVTNGATDTISMKALYINILTQTVGQLGATQASTDHAFALETLTVASLTETAAIATPRVYYVQFEATAFANTPGVFGLAVKTDIL